VRFKEVKSSRHKIAEGATMMFYRVVTGTLPPPFISIYITMHEVACLISTLAAKEPQMIQILCCYRHTFVCSSTRPRTSYPTFIPTRTLQGRAYNAVANFIGLIGPNLLLGNRGAILMTESHDRISYAPFPSLVRPRVRGGVLDDISTMLLLF